MFGKIDNRYARIAAYVLMAVAGAGGLLLVDSVASDAKESAEDAQEAAQSAKRAIEAVKEESDNRVLAICKASNENREVIIQFVEQFVASSGGAADFTRVPGFGNLSPELQDYLRALSVPEGTVTSADNRLLEIARQVLVPSDCEAALSN